jgi:hypothetical protein
MNGSDAILLLGAGVLGAGVPWVGMRLLVPSLAAGPTVTNFRGRPVFYGLGIVWLFWAGAAAVGGVAVSGIGRDSLVQLLTLMAPLALVTFALGLVDDAYGSGSDRGFRGHIAAGVKGRLTTGGLKVIGISVSSYATALFVVQVAQWAPWGSLQQLLLALPAGAAIALTANLINLMDLRPGRALKFYSLISLIGLVSVTLGLENHLPLDRVSQATDIMSLALFLLGPVVAVWRYDVGERGMLGDAGANPAGAIAGTVIVAGLPVWGMFGYLALVFALNLASERVSFSRVIENSAVLRRLDMLGRSEAAHAGQLSRESDDREGSGSE